VIFAVCADSVFAQGFSVQNKRPPPIAATDSFVSPEGKFSIALPQSHNGFTPITVQTLVGPATGDAYRWVMQEGSFIVGFFDVPPTADVPDSATLFPFIRDGLVEFATSKNGKLLSERKFDLEKHSAFELKIEYAGILSVQRFYLVSRRIYQVSLFVRTDQKPFEAAAVKALDSFKVLSDAQASALVKAKAAAAEPSALPQEPAIARVGSDAGDDDLQGKVKTVFEEKEDLSGTWSVQGKKPSSMTYYNERGNFTRKAEYDYKGNLGEIVVYGYIDGARVSSGKSIQHDYNPPPMVGGPAAGEVKIKSDPRYQTKFTFKYDEKKRLVERQLFRSDGELVLKHVYKYSGNEREEFVYNSDGLLSWHSLSVLNDKGVEIEETNFETKTGAISTKYSYAYEYDQKGNWIKRTVSKWVTKNGKSYYEPAYVTHHTIVYY
jgi:hypothetical protein